jgi:hypothetical protein
LVCVAGAVKCGVEPVAGAVAGEHAAGAIAAVGGWSEADESKPGIRIAKACDGPGPICLIVEAPRGGRRTGLPPLDQARTAMAAMDLGAELLQVPAFRHRDLPLGNH